MKYALLLAWAGVSAFMVSSATGCRSCKSGSVETKPAPSASVTNAPAKTTEPPLAKLSANDGNIALGNLDAQIESLKQQSAERAARISMVDFLLLRGEVRGRIADYQRAEEIAEALVVEAPTDVAGLLARASVHATFHRFDAALADLAEAEKQGAEGPKVVLPRVTILAARGHADEATSLLASLDASLGKDESKMSAMDLADVGFLAGDRGELAEAERLLALARARYRDVSPFPYAFFDVHQAALYERFGLGEKARRHYQRALAMVPNHPAAASHLAALSAPLEAIALLSPVLETSDDPEVLVQLADALRRAGKPEEAKIRLDAAIARYDALLAKYPLAFSDHAAAMWLGPGRDPARALPLAKTNADNRETVASIDLLLTAALAAGDAGEACVAAKKALALPHLTAELRTLATPIAGKCSP